jgi:flavin reductase (DIM6/NTAB) family NADH-FMN oxidoreductase RutF
MHKKKRLSLVEVYRLLEPGPVVLVSTASKGRSNVMTMSWHMMMEFEPPLVGCIVSARNHTFDLLQASRECVINIPDVALAKQVVGCGNTSGRNVDKFRRFGLTASASSRVGAPRIDECYANLECRVADSRMVARYNMFVLEVVHAWIDTSAKSPRTIHHAGKGLFTVAGERIRLRSKMK